MKANRSTTTSQQSARPRWASVVFISVLAAVMASTATTAMANFTGGPSVRVSPNVTFEIRYVADFVGEGKVEIFDNPNGTGAPIAAAVTGAPQNDQTLSFDVNNTVLADTRYHFRVTHHDPTNGVPDEVSQPPLPPVFTGAQAIGNVFVDAGVDRARILWDANVIGIGHVDYGHRLTG
jgi:hypothetical protein